MPSLRISNLVSACTRLQLDLARLARPAGKLAGQNSGFPTQGVVLEQIRGLVTAVEEIAASKGGIEALAGLPDPSRRAYQWLKYLSDPAHLAAHLQAVSAIEAGPSEILRKRLPAARRKLQVQVQFYNLPALYRARIGNGLVQIVAHEGFIGAPQEVLESLAYSAMSGKSGPHMARVKGYAVSPQFTNISMALESAAPSGTTQAAGQHVHLDEVFQRVNDRYFGGQMPRPHLVWNRSATYRKLGHYAPASDTVMLSRTLDDPQVPEMVVDFIMYHELLHKQLGIQVRGGRRYAHTHEFHLAEKKFAHYKQAQEYLKQIGNSRGI